MDDKKLEKQINEYQAVAKENPNINVGMLMMNALEHQKENLVPSKSKKWAYLASIGVPFAGFLFALAYFMRDEDDAKQVGWTCVVLSLICLGMTWIFGKLMFSSSGTSVEQIQQLQPQDIRNLIE